MSTVNHVEILARDSFKQVVEIDKPGQLIQWNFSTAKKSVGFAIYMHKPRSTLNGELNQSLPGINGVSNPDSSHKQIHGFDLNSDKLTKRSKSSGNVEELNTINRPYSTDDVFANLAKQQQQQRNEEESFPDKSSAELPARTQRSFSFAAASSDHQNKVSSSKSSSLFQRRNLKSFIQSIDSSSISAGSNVVEIPSSLSPITSSPLSGNSSPTYSIPTGTRNHAKDIFMERRPSSTGSSVKKSDLKQSFIEVNSDWVCVVPMKRYNASKVPVIGRYQARIAGTYLVVFDNSFSRSNSKNLTFTVQVISDVSHIVESFENRMEGWLLKKKRRTTQGFAKRWVTLHQGILSYYLSPTSSCRGSVSISSAAISVVPDEKMIVIDSGSLIYYFKTIKDEDLKKWVDTIRFYRNRYQPFRADDSLVDASLLPEEDKRIQSQLKDIRERLDLLQDKMQIARDSVSSVDLKHKIKKMIHSSDTRIYDDVMDDMNDLFFALSSCAVEISRAAVQTSRKPLVSFVPEKSSTTETPKSSVNSVYFDVEEDIILPETKSDWSELEDETDRENSSSAFLESSPESSIRSGSPQNESLLKKFNDLEIHDGDTLVSVRQTLEAIDEDIRLALPMKMPKMSINIFSILRKNIGKDLTSISMPVQMNQPLTLLQKIAEEVEYSNLLDKASREPNSLHRLGYVTAFAITAYSWSAYRVARKPFNPLLGETFEYVDKNRNLRFISEKVKHNPHIMACHAESDTFVYWQTSQVKTSFWGKSIELTPMGKVRIKLKNFDEIYEWNKVSAHVNLIGGFSVEHYGDLTVKNLNTGEFAVLNFEQSSLFSSSDRKISGSVFDKNSKEAYSLHGKWHQYIHKHSEYGTEEIWKIEPLPDVANEQYGFSTFAMNLNYKNEKLASQLPQTDSRLRKDQVLLENGHLSDAETEKNRLEKNQRERRKLMESKNQKWDPLWFKETMVSSLKCPDFVYTGGYWEARHKGTFPELKIF